MTAWPGTLPQNVSKDDYSETTQPTALRTQPSAGPFKSRQQFTAGMDIFTVRLPKMSSAQCTTLMDFFKGDLAGGSLPFDWIHPRTGALASCIMSKEPTITGRGGAYYAVAFEITILP